MKTSVLIFGVFVGSYMHCALAMASPTDGSAKRVAAQAAVMAAVVANRPPTRADIKRYCGTPLSEDNTANLFRYAIHNNMIPTVGVTAAERSAL